MPRLGWIFDWHRRVQTRLFTALLASEFYALGSGARVSPPFRFANLKRVSLGHGVVVNRDCWILTLSGFEDTKEPLIIVKPHAVIGMGATISAAQKVVIGEHVLMARNVYISDHGHAYEDIGAPISSQGIAKIMPVSIGDRTWLGQNVSILPGASLGKHCVVGANSVVLSGIPDFSVAVGCPARVIKKYNPCTHAWERV